MVVEVVEVLVLMFLWWHGQKLLLLYTLSEIMWRCNGAAAANSDETAPNMRTHV